VHVEVAETGLRGNDSRLYASGAPGIGATIEEALALSAKSACAAAAKNVHPREQGFRNYHIPSELLVTSQVSSKKSDSGDKVTTGSQQQQQERCPADAMQMPRGGSWQADETSFYTHNPEDVFTANPYDTVREDEYQQLHEQMYNEYGVVDQPHPAAEQRYVKLFTSVYAEGAFY
jgi:hypothetical protein